jgi:hypothetical protein
MKLVVCRGDSVVVQVAGEGFVLDDVTAGRTLQAGVAAIDCS